MKSNYYFS